MRFDALIVASDTLAICIALPATYFLRFHLSFPFAPRGEWRVEDYLYIFPFALATWLVSLAAVGVYRRSHEIMSAAVFQQLVKASLLAIVIIIALNFFFRIVPEQSLARILAPLSLVLALTALYIGRTICRKYVRYLQKRREMGLRRLLIYGTGDIALDVVQRLRESPHSLFQLVGFLSGDPAKKGHSLEGLEVFADGEGMPDLLREQNIDEIILAEPALSPEQTLSLMLDCEREMVGCRTVPSLFQMRLAEVQTDPVEGVPLYGLKETPLHGLNIVIKRVFDFVVALFVLIVTLPFIPFIALAIKLDSKGPILYKQKRVGLDGRRYSLYKFRSMIADAEEKSGPVWAKKDDPRKTRFGRFMRTWNIDELPQLFNVLRGDMSLVGPRPERPFFVKQFKHEQPRYMARHKVKSGLTGWAQVHGLRGEASVSERLEFDLYYIEHWSFWLDLRILLMTIRAWRRGAV